MLALVASVWQCRAAQGKRRTGAKAKATKAAKKAHAATPAHASATIRPATLRQAARQAKDRTGGGKRDPFAPLINNKKDAGPHLPPGKAGLVIAYRARGRRGASAGAE